MTMLRPLMAFALVAGALLPAGAHAQTVNPYLPMTTKPPGPANPKPFDPGQPVPEVRSGVIPPPPIGSRMPVIHPTTPSRMPVLSPPGTPGNSPNVLPK